MKGQPYKHKCIGRLGIEAPGNPHDLAQERAQRLRIALLNEWRRIKIDWAKCDKPSTTANELQVHADVIAAVLETDREIEAEVRKARDMAAEPKS